MSVIPAPGTSKSLTIQPPFVIGGHLYTVECSGSSKLLQIELYPTINGNTLSSCASVHQDGSCDKTCSVASSSSCSFPTDNETMIQLIIDQPQNIRWICVFTASDQEVEYLYKDITVGKLYDIPVYTITCTLSKS